MSTSLHSGDASADHDRRVGTVSDWLDAKESLGMLLAAIGMCSEDQLIPWIERHGAALQEGDHPRLLASALADARYAPVGKHAKPKGLTSLYRMFDDAGELLYVGMTARPGDRWDYHRGSVFWWPRVASITVEHFAMRSEATVAELAAIANEQPQFNVIGQQPGYPPYSG